MKRRSYPDDLTDQEWEQIQDLATKQFNPRGRKGKYSKREMLNAIFYLLRSGCSWRLLPHDFPPWKSVYAQFSKWKRTGTFMKIYERLRKKLGRNIYVSAGIIDSQSVKTTEKGALEVMMEEKRSMVEKGIFS
ncbi:MAG: transposase [Chlamydiales bacterium]|nr:transposase [Chlamydiales bacterium]